MSSNRQLLFPSSIIFDNANLTDQIHQTIIDLENNQNKTEVQNLINKSLETLDNKNLDYYEINEIFSLISSLILHHRYQTKEFYQELLEDTHKNSHRIIIAASIFSDFLDNETRKSFPLFSDFLKTSINASFKYILKKEKNLVIFDHKINPQYELSFIVDLINMTKISEQIIKKSYPFVFGHANLTKNVLNKYVYKIIDSKLVSCIVDPIITDKFILSNISMSNFAQIIPEIPDQIFIQNFRQIEEIFLLNDDESDRLFSIEIINKCNKLNINIKNIKIILKPLLSSDYSLSIWCYLDRNNVTLTENESKNFTKFPNPAAAIKIMPHFSNVPSDVLINGLLELHELKTYERLSEMDNINKDIFSKSQFWIHLLSVIGESSEKCSEKLMTILESLFRECVTRGNFDSMFDQVISSIYPTNNNQNEFLDSFFKKLDFCYIKKIDQIEVNKSIPLPSFWKLFVLDINEDFFNNDNINPILLYAYEFCSERRAGKQFTKLIISNSIRLSKNKPMLIHFLKNNDLDYLANMNKDCLSFIMPALIFTNNCKKTIIEGITDTRILPFFAIILNYMKKTRRKLDFIFPEISDLLLTACKNFPNAMNELTTTSVDIILSNYDILFDPQLFPKYMASQIIDIFIDQLYSDCYKADKFIFFTAVFNLSIQHLINFSLFDFFDRLGINFVNYFIHNFFQINDYEKFTNCTLNLAVFKNDQLINTLSEIFQNSSSSYEDIVHTVYFLERLCNNVPNLSSFDFTRLKEVFAIALMEKKRDDFILLEQFMRNNHIYNDFASKSTDDIYKYLAISLICPNLEKMNSILYTIFKALMTNQQIAVDYLIILFEKISRKQEVKTKKLMSYYSVQYETYGDCFISAIQRVFSYNSSRNLFVRKAEFQSISEQVPEFENTLINKLLNTVFKKPTKYQVYVSLINISSSFPFLFTYVTHKMFKNVLSSLNYFSLLFTVQNDTLKDEYIDLSKTAVASLYFLFSTLISVKTLDDFIPWLFENMKSFSPSQIIAMSYILFSLFQTNELSYIVLALSFKYNFLHIIKKLLEKETEKELIFHYKSHIYKLLIAYYNAFNDLQKNQIILIEEIQNLENPFSIRFNHFSTICPAELQPLNLQIPNDSVIFNSIFDFISDIQKLQPFWICFKQTKSRYKSSLSQTLVSHYLSLETKVNQSNYSPNLPPVPNLNNIKMNRYFSVQPKWIYDWFLQGKRFNILPEHGKVLSKITKEVRKIDEKSSHMYDNEMHQNYSDMNKYEYFLFYIYQKGLYYSLLNESCSYTSNLFLLLCSVWRSIPEISVIQINIYNMMKSFISENKNKRNSSESFDKLFPILIDLNSKYSYESRKTFIDICGSCLIDLILSPNYRSNKYLLKKVSNLIIFSDQKHLSPRVSHLIGFMLLCSQISFTSEILQLCARIGENNFANISKNIENYFEIAYNDSPHYYIILYYFLLYVPSFFERKKNILPAKINEIIVYYQDHKDDSYLIDFICMLFDTIAPERFDEQDEIPTDKIKFPELSSLNKTKEKLDDSQMIIKKASSSLVQSNPDFWELYNKHLLLLNEFLSNKEKNSCKLMFLYDYPELLSFQTRLKKFREKMRSRINMHDILRLNVDRSRILHNSFQLLQHKSTNQWLSDFRVSFEHEYGIDAGGLTKEWFSLVVKELFNENFALFKLCETKSYQPYPSSGTNNLHLEYFKFAGKIIARAIIQEQCVDAHFTRSFLKQILRRQIKFKDIKYFDPALYESFKQTLNSDVSQCCLYFEIDIDEFGANKSILLKENGDQIEVTNENKYEYINLYINHLLRSSIIDQVNAFCDGFYSLILYEDISVFSPKELDLLICGKHYDISDLKRNSKFDPPYSSDHPVIKMFFNVISRWKTEEIGMLLQFVTGSSQVPVNGFKDYKDRGRPITFHYINDKKKLCCSHTCSNIIDLPEYDNEDDMNNKLILAIHESSFQNS